MFISVFSAFMLLANMSSTKVYLRYVVLNFIEQNEVEVAPPSWLERINGVLFCYWPNSNVGTKVQKCVIPDKQLWTKYALRVFSDTDSYNLATYRVQKAVETSHVEDSDGNFSRKITPPRRFREEELQATKPRKTRCEEMIHKGQNIKGILPKNENSVIILTLELFQPSGEPGEEEFESTLNSPMNMSLQDLLQDRTILLGVGDTDLPTINIADFWMF
ncbi:uncharacterized protein LOC113046544 [Carassius auratus]|uniref:Uncharacterized protein LOC113046544 n=1 Tax=Carassius auratus TaxID=7957 RepID=A0A6P6JVJ6_CARAU|nr:uncharacterized protein LOC113046544 [Carassius auratus]